MKVWKVTKPWLRMSCDLGEAPFFEPYSNRLRFVDIIGKKLHSADVNPNEVGQSTLVSANTTDAVGITADIEGQEGKKCIVGAKYGYAIMDRGTGDLSYVKKFWNEDEVKNGKAKRLRSNDGNVDPLGRFWIGTMNDGAEGFDPSNEGVVFRLHPDGKLDRPIDKVTIPNGIGWSPDAKIMYFADSPTKSIFAFDFDMSSGNISNRRTFWKVPDDEPEDVVPDGFSVDVEGNIWQALHGGSKVVRISPQGQIIGKVELPTRCPTCPRFVGEELFITSSAEEKPKEYPQSVELAGSVFRVHVGVRGMSQHKWSGVTEPVDS